MKEIPEPQHDFALYLPHMQYIEREGEPLKQLYEAGFLPYSGKKDSRDIFYNARSARIALPRLELSSENRRIAKKFDGAFGKTRAPAGEFDFDESFYGFCLAYFEGKHGPTAMPRARLEAIVSSGLLSNVVIYRIGSQPKAYVLEVEDGSMCHFWYSFYDLSLAKQSLGLWLMLDALRDAKARDLKQYYLGTVYGEKTLYKTNFKPLQWWDGRAWSEDIKALKAQARG